MNVEGYRQLPGGDWLPARIFESLLPGGQADINRRLVNRTYIGPLGIASQNPFVDSDVVPTGFYWLVYFASLFFPVGNSANIGEFNAFIVPPQAIDLLGQVLPLNALTGQVADPRLIRISWTIPVDESATLASIPKSINRRFIVPSGWFIKGSLLNKNAPANANTYKLSLQLQMIQLSNSEKVPDF